MTRKNSVVMCITGDEYELPIFITDTVKEMAEICGISRETVSSHIYYNRNKMHMKKHGRTFIRVVI